uniref:Ig-like domain-containing protein n=1 Tax=Stegastes partitus TaxID=144197 RepID=A0A3B5AV60_9TELE
EHCGLNSDAANLWIFVSFTNLPRDEIQVNQSPSAVFRKEGEEVQLICTHERSDYRVMLWYQKSPGDEALKLIGYGYTQFKDDGVEEPFRKHFKLAGNLSEDKKNGSLSIISLKVQEHTATYFCAASEPQYIKHPPAPDKNLFPSRL